MFTLLIGTAFNKKIGYFVKVKKCMEVKLSKISIFDSDYFKAGFHIILKISYTKLQHLDSGLRLHPQIK